MFRKYPRQRDRLEWVRWQLLPQQMSTNLRGFGPNTGFKSKKAHRLVAMGFLGAPGRIRTSGRLIRSQVLYPAELLARERGGT